MKKGIILLIAAGLLAALAAIGVRAWSGQRAQPMNWLRTEFSLDSGQAARAEAGYAEYQADCAEMCARIAEADLRLEQLIRTHAEVTPAIRQAIAETDALRSDCRARMLEHFYRIARDIPPDRREKYLGMVLPNVLHPGEMGTTHRAHE